MCSINGKHWKMFWVNAISFHSTTDVLKIEGFGQQQIQDFRSKAQLRMPKSEILRER